VGSLGRFERANFVGQLPTYSASDSGHVKTLQNIRNSCSRGAAGGCAVGHHEASKKEKKAQQVDAGNPASAANSK
jgi:hypothetical protein